ncbi:hypothetical protein J1605_001728 [Eschrichtius robustus]|uniref:Uncharacterized protein n=1 Tax=Eschrichtius robustus TaxID=9764 RepID=A0AB34HZ23_ESCRO|nr:hypothetical protein J1605_001728 [Eschrichtius robustus]
MCTSNILEARAGARGRAGGGTRCARPGALFTRRPSNRRARGRSVERRAGAEPGAAGECGLRAAGVFAAVRVDAPPPRVSPAPVSPCLPADTLLLPGPGLPLRRRAPRARPGSTLVSRPLSLPPPPLQLCLRPGAVLAAALPPPLPAQPGKPASRSSAFRPSGGRLVCALSSGLSVVGSHGRGTDKVHAGDGCGARG